MTVASLVEKFLAHRTRAGCKPATLRQYRGRMKPLAAAFGDREWTSLAREELLDWLFAANRWPDGRPKSPATVRANVIALQLLQQFASEEHELPPVLRKKDLEKPACPQRERIATPEETRQILAIAPEDWARIYRALRLTGARPNELVRAKISDLQGGALVLADHKTARKTGKPRRIPIGKTVAPLIAEAVGSRTEGHIFLDGRGKPWSVPRVSQVFRRLRDQLGLTRELVLYSARHEFGTAVAKVFDINKAKDLLGHSDISTTQRYTHLSQEELRGYQEGAIEDIANDAA